MLSILTIIGARPQFIKAAALSRAIRDQFSDRISEVIVHTGQHYDENMSQVFFEQMEIPKPDFNLGIGSGSHAEQTAGMLTGIETIIREKRPDSVVLYGDTNSTLAGAVAAAKLHIPVVHIEAGLRSFNKAMPEEINRIGCDHFSTLLFTPTETGYNNLLKEGFQDTRQVENNGFCDADHPRIYHCGDVMYDNSLYFSQQADKRSNILGSQDLNSRNFILATIHRDNNTDIPERLLDLLNSLHNLSAGHNLDVVLPIHPRTRKNLDKLPRERIQHFINNPKLKIIPPASFFDMIVLEKHCRLVMTDSGGVQKEAYFFKKPCIILRSETEWTELVENRTAMICDANPQRIENAFNHFTNENNMQFPPIFGNGKAAEFICRKMVKYLGT